MKKILIFSSILFVVCFGLAYAQDTEKPAEPAATAEGESEVYVFPEIEPEASITAGYRIVDHNGSTRAGEYEYHKSFPTLGGELRTITATHRLHLEFETVNEKDYYGDITYMYKDLILFRGVNSTGFHNLDNKELFEFTCPTCRTYEVNRMDIDSEYGTRTGISNLLLRFKMPDFPAHLYAEANFVDRSGSAQQMFYHGGDTSRRTSRERDMDRLTSVYTVGANSQLGPVAVDFSHSEKRLRVGGDSVFRDRFDEYRDRTTGAVLRTAGDYYHNLIPEIKSSTNTLRLQTSMTGSIVSTATLSRTDKENTESGATAKYVMGAGDFTWIPRTDLVFAVKYRHSETDMDNPDSVSVRNLTTNDVYTYSVRDSISSSSDVVSGVVRYRPVKGVLLKADYTHEEINRSNEDPWHVIPGSTSKNTFSLAGDVRLMKGLKLTAKFIHKNINSPAVNTEPDRSDEGLLTLSWTPAARFHAYISYGIRDEKRNDLKYVFDGCADGICTGEDRKVRNDRLIGTVSYSPLNNLTAIASYAYMHTKVRQDIMYEISVAPDYETDFLVPYKTTSQHYSFDISYRPKAHIGLNAGVSHTVSEGSFYPSATTLTQDVNVASFSDLKIRETTYSIGSEYQFKGGITAGMQYRYSTFNDIIDNPYNDANDGRASIVLLTLTKKW